MTAFAYYRLPYLHHAHYVAQREGEPEVLSSVDFRARRVIPSGIIQIVPLV